MEKKEVTSKRKKRILTAAVIIAAAIVVFFAAAGFYFKTHWYPRTSINGIDFSFQSFEESLSQVEQVIQDYELTLLGREDGKDVISGESINLKGNVSDTLQQLYRRQHESYFLKTLFTGDQQDFAYDLSFDEDKLKSILESSLLVKGSDTYKITKPKSAYVTYSEEKGYGVIVDEIDGNKLDFDAALAYTTEAVYRLSDSLNFDDAAEYPDAYLQPACRAKDKIIQKQYTTYNSYLLNWIVWDMGKDTTESLTPDEIKNWLSVNKKHKVVLDEDAVKKWIETFCLKYKTVGITRDFKTHSGETIPVSGGDYGWRIDYEQTVADTLNQIKGKRDEQALKAYIDNPSAAAKEALTTKWEPKYSNTAYKKDYTHFKNDWDTENYSEVDISEQRVYVYKNGTLAFSTTCVTGLPKDGRDTTTGCWYIKDKKEEYTLVGADYETDTEFWVRITWMGIGYHYMNRSDWGRWSPSLYKTRGSHGCINLRYNDARSIYNLVKLGDPVFIHY